MLREKFARQRRLVSIEVLGDLAQAVGLADVCRGQSRVTDDVGDENRSREVVGDPCRPCCYLLWHQCTSINLHVPHCGGPWRIRSYTIPALQATRGALIGTRTLDRSCAFAR